MRDYCKVLLDMIHNMNTLMFEQTTYLMIPGMPPVTVARRLLDHYACDGRAAVAAAVVKDGSLRSLMHICLAARRAPRVPLRA